MEPEVGLDILGDFPDQTLEGELTDEELWYLLISLRATIPGILTPPVEEADILAALVANYFLGALPLVDFKQSA